LSHRKSTNISMSMLLCVVEEVVVVPCVVVVMVASMVVAAEDTMVIAAEEKYRVKFVGRQGTRCSGAIRDLMQATSVKISKQMQK
jgi:predicted RNA-binding protein YlqC (UPF0109 family)